MAADTTGDVDTADSSGGGLKVQSEEAFKNLDLETRKRMIETADSEAKKRLEKEQTETPQKQTDTSVLARTGDKGTSALTVTAKKEPEVQPSGEAQPSAVPAPSLSPPPSDKPPERSSGQIYGRQTIFHWNYDGSRDKEDPGSKGFFGVNLDDPNLIGAAVPVDILEAQFGKFTRTLPDGTYAALDTPEAREIIARIKSSHVLVNAPDGRQVEMPIVDIQGSYKNWHRVLDLTLGATKALGIKDDTYLGYSIVAGDGTVMSADGKWSDTSPVAKLYQQHGKEFVDTYPKEVLRASKANIAPNMPDEDYDRAMRDPNGKEELAKYKAQPKSPGEQLSSMEGTPYAGLSKDDLTKKVYSDLVHLKKIDPAKVDLSEIGDKLFPNPSVVESMGQLFNWDSSFWTAAKRGASEETHQQSAQAYDLPKNLEEFGKLFSNPVVQKIDQWLDKNTPVEDYWRKFVGYMHGLSQAQTNQAQVDDQRKAQAATTVPGKVGAVVGGVGAGTVGQLATTLVPGAPIKSAVVLASVYEGISRYGQAAEKGQSDALVQGIEGAGMGAFSRYMMDAPNGRAMTAFTTWLANTGEDTLSKMLKGEHVDLTETTTRSLIDVTTGALMAHGKERPKTGLAEEVMRTEAEKAQGEVERLKLARHVLGPEVSEEEPWYKPGPIVTRPAERQTFTPQELSLAAGKLPSGVSTSELVRRAELIQPPVSGRREVHLAEDDYKAHRDTILRAEAQSMQLAKENGDYQGAVEHGNRALAMMNGDEQQQIAKDVIKFSEKWANNKATPGQEPTIKLSDTERGMVDHLAGLGSVETLEGRPLDLNETIGEFFQVEGIEKDGEPAIEEAPAEEVKPTEEVKPEVSALERRAPPDYSGEQFHAGLPIAPGVRAAREGIKALGRTDPIKVIREQMGGIDPEMTGIIRARRSEMEENIVRLPSEMARAMRIDTVLRGGEKVGVRRDSFAKFPKSVQKAMLIAHEKKLPVGDPVAEALFKIHDAVYKALEAREKLAGFTYKAREVYIYHLVKGGKEARDKFQNWYDAKIASDPRWMHQRVYSQLEDLHKAGFELETYNPEELLQRRIFNSEAAVSKVKQLRDAERAGAAYRTNHPTLSAEIKAWPEARAPNGERYYLRPDAEAPLNNAWDTTSIYNSRMVGKPLKVLAALKAVSVPLKLGLSFVHGKHVGLKMNVSSFLNTLFQAELHGLHGAERGKVYARELERMAKVGYAHSAEVQILQGKRSGKGASLEEKTNIKHFEWAGLSARISDETRKSFEGDMRQWFSNQMDRLQVPHGTREKVHGAATLLQHGYDIVSSRVMQHWMFNTMIPQIKFSQFLGMRDNLIRQHPELLEPKNEFKLKKELSRIGESVEARFGEMFHDNLLWKKAWKDIATASLLSYGWQLGAVRIYAGAIRDTAALGAKILEEGRISKDDLTDRITFAGWYTALNMVEAGVITYTTTSLWNAAHPDKKHDPMPDGMDYVFPRVGYDAAGRPKRVSPVEYSRELATLWQHTKDQGFQKAVTGMARNKLSPVISTLIDEWQHKNFYGQQIYNPNDPWLKQVQDQVGYFLQNTFEPISVSSAPGIGQQTGRERSWSDVAWAAIGFPPAPAWTGRSDIENWIVERYHDTHGTHQQKPNNIERGNQYEALRQAVNEKNLVAQHSAEQALHNLGVPKNTISYVRNHPHESIEDHYFKGLESGDQLNALKRMNKDQLREYWPLAHKDLRLKYHNEATALQRP